eukprot:scaffold7382_cov406-Prasinococcus_capsulatus_cf.AAC.8
MPTATAPLGGCYQWPRRRTLPQPMYRQRIGRGVPRPRPAHDLPWALRWRRDARNAATPTSPDAGTPSRAQPVRCVKITVPGARRARGARGRPQPSSARGLLHEAQYGTKLHTDSREAKVSGDGDRASEE